MQEIMNPLFCGQRVMQIRLTVNYHRHIYFSRITQKNNQSQISQYNRKAAIEAQNSLTGRLCNY